MQKINIDIPEKAIEILEPAGSTVVETFTDTWSFVFGPLQTYFKKQNYLRKKELEEFYASVDLEFSKISQENIAANPNFRIIGQTIEASKWSIDESELRSMFAKLIAKSFDTTQLDVIHPSFVEIIKQLNPLDANILYSVYNENNVGIIKGNLIKKHYTPNLNLVNSVERSAETYNYYYLSDKYNMDLINISLDNLVRLNLIDISYDIKLIKNSYYSKVKRRYHNEIRKILLENNHASIENGFNIEMLYGKILPTTLGNVFTSICLN